MNRALEKKMRHLWDIEGRFRPKQFFLCCDHMKRLTNQNGYRRTKKPHLKWQCMWCSSLFNFCILSWMNYMPHWLLRRLTLQSIIKTLDETLYQRHLPFGYSGVYVRSKLRRGGQPRQESCPCKFLVFLMLILRSNFASRDFEQCTVKLLYVKLYSYIVNVAHVYRQRATLFPLLLGQPSSSLLATTQAGGPPSVEIGWATKTIIFEDVRGHKMTSVFMCKFFGQFAVLGIFFSPCLLVKIIRNSPRKIGATK